MMSSLDWQVDHLAQVLTGDPLEQCCARDDHRVRTSEGSINTAARVFMFWSRSWRGIQNLLEASKNALATLLKIVLERRLI